MPRKEKPMRSRRPKEVHESLVYNTAQLCARYGISRRTLRRWGEERGYAPHWRNGRNEVYAKRGCHDWERIHMPHLNPEPEMSEEDKHWDQIRRQYLLDKEVRESKPSPPPKPKRPRRPH